MFSDCSTTGFKGGGGGEPSQDKILSLFTFSVLTGVIYRNKHTELATKVLHLPDS